MKKASFFLPLLLCLASCTSNSEVTNTVTEEGTTVMPTPTDVPAPSTDVPPTTTPAPTGNTKDTPTPKAPELGKAEKMCFQNQERRTLSTVMLSISGGKVSGSYDWQPFEKDGRHGTLSGIVEPAGTERKIKATWTYQQEGMKQKLPFEALLMPNGIRQKAYRFDAKTGMEALESGNSYSIVYKKAACQ